MESIHNDESSDESEGFQEELLNLASSFLVKKEEIPEVSTTEP